ncbi:hypothetical protein [Alkalicoccobacillus porphyridii]|uniref:Lipoprotein n=1 Tax=Alkalicoccobacillus porphyridii TaxID=2597270 RepID=A0A554A291_9BACI|nr:hypothetical protein [Alkalicoccobacillus porphyridii]TSB47811.1 hypothetical protein FN960_04655 [Alkalicoccobacillus porphyridii]
MIKLKWFPFLLIGVSISLISCEVANDAENDNLNSETEEYEELSIEIIIESNATYATDLEVNVNSRKDPQSIIEPTIEVPYSEKFIISTDTMFPITSTNVKASVGEDGDEISCKIVYDDTVVATHSSKGKFATVLCENKFIDNILSFKVGHLGTRLQNPASLHD